MAAGRVQTATNQGTALTVVASFGSSSVSGDYIAVGIFTAFTAFSALTGVTDSKGNTYTEVGTAITISNGNLRVFRAKNITGGASHTVTATFSGTGQTNGILCKEWGGLDTGATPDDQTGTGTNGGGTAMSVATSSADTNAVDLAYVFIATQNSGMTNTPGAGYGNSLTAPAGGGTLMIMDGDLTSTGIKTATSTISSFTAWSARIVTVKEASGVPFLAKPYVARNQAVKRASNW